MLLIAAEDDHVAAAERPLSPATASRSSPASQVRYSRVPAVCGTPAMRAARRQLHPLDLHAGDGVGQQLARW